MKSYDYIVVDAGMGKAFDKFRIRNNKLFFFSQFFNLLIICAKCFITHL